LINFNKEGISATVATEIFSFMLQRCNTENKKALNTQGFVL
jgi:hypothetical protein